MVMYRQLGHSSIFWFKTSVSLPPDPSVHNVVVQEGEIEGQKAVLLESLQHGFVVNNEAPSKQGAMHNNDGWRHHTSTHNQQQ
jgi:hypothetical protein